jgi:hypothetical protein
MAIEVEADHHGSWQLLVMIGARSRQICYARHWH